MKDPRFFPEGRARVYLSPAHMDIHCGSCGFFVERLNDQYTLGYYDMNTGREHARVVSPALAREFRALAREAAREYGQSCGNGVCEEALLKKGASR
jgi:hypothetical protein